MLRHDYWLRNSVTTTLTVTLRRHAFVLLRRSVTAAHSVIMTRHRNSATPRYGDGVGRDVNLDVADNDMTSRVTSSKSHPPPSPRQLTAAEVATATCANRDCAVAPSGLATLTPHYLIKYRLGKAVASIRRQSPLYSRLTD